MGDHCLVNTLESFSIRGSILCRITWLLHWLILMTLVPVISLGNTKWPQWHWPYHFLNWFCYLSFTVSLYSTIFSVHLNAFKSQKVLHKNAHFFHFIFFLSCFYFLWSIGPQPTDAISSYLMSLAARSLSCSHNSSLPLSLFSLCFWSSSIYFVL